MNSKKLLHSLNVFLHLVVSKSFAVAFRMAQRPWFGAGHHHSSHASLAEATCDILNASGMPKWEESISSARKGKMEPSSSRRTLTGLGAASASSPSLVITCSIISVRCFIVASIRVVASQSMIVLVHVFAFPVPVRMLLLVLLVPVPMLTPVPLVSLFVLVTGPVLSLLVFAPVVLVPVSVLMLGPVLPLPMFAPVLLVSVSSTVLVLVFSTTFCKSSDCNCKPCSILSVLSSCRWCNDTVPIVAPRAFEAVFREPIFVEGVPFFEPEKVHTKQAAKYKI